MSDMSRRDDKELLTPGEVARMFGVDPKTVTRWAAAGKLEALRTLGGHRRYRASEVNRLLEQRTAKAPMVDGSASIPRLRERYARLQASHGVADQNGS